MRLRLLGAAAAMTLLVACGSGDGDGPSISATLPPDASLPSGDTSPPDAAPPDSAAPPETQPPETQPPETQPPETAPPETPPPETAAPETAPPTTDPLTGDDESTAWWPWLIAGLVVVGVVAFAMTRSKGKPSTAPWHIRTITLLDDIDQLTSHLPGLTPEGLATVAASDARALATFRATADDLLTTAPDTAEQMSISKLSIPLAELHAALDAVALSGQPILGISTAQLATQLHTASASVRADLALRA